MEQASRKHWRAAAWLLERQNPEHYARKPVNTTSAKKVAAALRFVQEMALEAVPAEFHERLYQHVQAGMEEAFRHCFPTMGKWETPKFPKLPIETPLADVQAEKVREANVGILHDLVPSSPVDPAELSPKTSEATLRSPIGRVEATERQAEQAARQATAAKLQQWLTEQLPAELSPKTREATGDATAVDPLYVSFAEEQAVLEQEECRREQREMNLQIRRAFDAAEQNPCELFNFAAVAQPPGGRVARLQERQRERAAAKKAKAARKRAQAQRRRAA